MSTTPKPPSVEDLIEELARLRDEDRAELIAWQTAMDVERSGLIQRIATLEARRLLRWPHIFARI